MFKVMQTAVKASMTEAWLKLPALSGRRPRIATTRDSVTTDASGWSEHTSTSDSNPDSKFSISPAGRWWKAADTNDSGNAAWTDAATEPRGGIRASISRPSLIRALAMETTTLPANSSRSGLRVAMALSHGVARITTSALAA